MSEQTQERSDPPATTKPDGLPDDFWDAGAGSVRLDQLIPKFNDLTAAHAAREAAAASIPSDAEGYELGLPEGFEAPEGFAMDFSADPRVPDIKAWAHKHGLAPDAVKDLMGIYAKSELESFQFATEQKALLGKNADARLADIRVALNAVLPADQAGALAESLASADAVKAIEKLLSGRKANPPAPAQETPAKSALADLKPEQRLRAMMAGGPKK